MKKSLLLGIAFACTTMLLHAEFKAGFARMDATPPLGIPMVGYFNKRNATDILDPLCVECVAISDGEKTALVYSVDDLHLTKSFFDKAFPAITKATGVPRDLIYVHATHTHTGPSDWMRKGFSKEENRLILDFAELRITRLADTGRLAIKDLAPAKIGIAKTKCEKVSFIRRFRMKDGSIRTNPGMRNKNVKEPIGTPDETLQLVRFIRTGAPDIAIVNFGTHTDTVGGTKISADWPGVLRSTFENGIGGGVKCLFLNGAQGDVNHYCIKPSPERKSLTREKIYKFIGQRLAGTAMSIWDLYEEVPAGKVNGIVAPATMKTNIPTADEIKWVKMFDEGREKEIPLSGMEIKTLTGPGSRVRKLMNGPAELDILVSNISIGDSIAFSGMPCEPFVDIGRDVKAQSPFRMTIVTCLTNGSEGYIPSTKAHHEGGYEGLSSRFAAPTGDNLVAAQIKQLKELKDAASK
ncbi:MAG: hypothetical protein J6R18_07195 [Kiritimatiellae bacterium]|nr:hypothetical protein [Kiritimatiellia bacterium]